jgi:CHASE2 domain-containing sensor protein
MKDVWIAAAGFVLGWLVSKTWQDPGCRVGLTMFLVITAVMALAFVLAVVGHGRPVDPPHDEEDEGD